MGCGYHGGFGATSGAKHSYGFKSNTFTPVQFTGSVKVGGVEFDVSRRVYQRNDIDFNRIDPDTGMSNLERMIKGNAPYGSDNKPIELHHVIQKESGPMVEIRETTHREYKSTLHGLRGYGESFRNDPLLEKQYTNFKRAYWKWRAQKYKEGLS